VALPSASIVAALRRDGKERPPAARTLAILADPVFEADDPRVVRAAQSTRHETPAAASRTSDRPNLVRLPFTREEATAIATLTGSKGVLVATGFNASRATAMNGSLSQYRIVHFATHGVIDSERPALTALVLSLVDKRGAAQDGYLRIHDIYAMRLDADLVVLSACQTALGKQIKGEGLVGLTRAFMYAGAPRVVASLWQVSDRATAALMQRFYAGMLQHHLRPAAALRAAQIQMSHEPVWAHPYYWAGFVLQGDWR
jgi:CHAT domain-containing protein